MPIDRNGAYALPDQYGGGWTVKTMRVTSATDFYKKALAETVPVRTRTQRKKERIEFKKPKDLRLTKYQKRRLHSLAADMVQGGYRLEACRSIRIVDKGATMYRYPDNKSSGYKYIEMQLANKYTLAGYLVRSNASLNYTRKMADLLEK